MAIATSDEVRLSYSDIHALEWEPLGGLPGVSLKTLWRDPTGCSHAGLMRMAPGSSIPQHRHRHGTHHVWIESGSCAVDGRTYGPGAYFHVPVGVLHGVEGVGEGGCTMLYLYLATAGFD